MSSTAAAPATASSNNGATDKQLLRKMVKISADPSRSLALHASDGKTLSLGELRKALYTLGIALPNVEIGQLLSRYAVVQPPADSDAAFVGSAAPMPQLKFDIGKFVQKNGGTTASSPSSRAAATDSRFLQFGCDSVVRSPHGVTADALHRALPFGSRELSPQKGVVMGREDHLSFEGGALVPNVAPPLRGPIQVEKEASALDGVGGLNRWVGDQGASYIQRSKSKPATWSFGEEGQSYASHQAHHYEDFVSEIHQPTASLQERGVHPPHRRASVDADSAVPQQQQQAARVPPPVPNGELTREQQVKRRADMLKALLLEQDASASSSSSVAGASENAFSSFEGSQSQQRPAVPDLRLGEQQQQQHHHHHHHQQQPRRASPPPPPSKPVAMDVATLAALAADDALPSDAYEYRVSSSVSDAAMPVDHHQQHHHHHSSSSSSTGRDQAYDFSQRRLRHYPLGSPNAGTSQHHQHAESSSSSSLSTVSVSGRSMDLQEAAALVAATTYSYQDSTAGSSVSGPGAASAREYGYGQHAVNPLSVQPAVVPAAGLSSTARALLAASSGKARPIAPGSTNPLVLRRIAATGAPAVDPPPPIYDVNAQHAPAYGGTPFYAGLGAAETIAGDWGQAVYSAASEQATARATAQLEERADLVRSALRSALPPHPAHAKAALAAHLSRADADKDGLIRDTDLLYRLRIISPEVTSTDIAAAVHQAALAEKNVTDDGRDVNGGKQSVLPTLVDGWEPSGLAVGAGTSDRDISVKGFVDWCMQGDPRKWQEARKLLQHQQQTQAPPAGRPSNNFKDINRGVSMASNPPPHIIPAGGSFAEAHAKRKALKSGAGGGSGGGGGGQHHSQVPESDRSAWLASSKSFEAFKNSWVTKHGEAARKEMDMDSRREVVGPTWSNANPLPFKVLRLAEHKPPTPPKVKAALQGGGAAAAAAH